MAQWNHDISKAPRGHYDVVPAGPDKTGSRKVFKADEIIAASPCGIVCVTYWIDAEKRWNMFAAGVQPVAWMSYAGPIQIIDPKGKTRNVVDLPAHPPMATSWFRDLLAGRRAA